MMEATSYSPRFDVALGFEQISGPKDKQPRKVWENPEALALIDKAMQVTDPKPSGSRSSTSCTRCCWRTCR